MLESLGKPKKLSSNYMIFCAERRTGLASSVTPTEKMKVMAAEWADMSEQQKEIYNEKYNVAKTEHDKAMEKWVAKMTKDGKMVGIEKAQLRVASLRRR
jgi:hypothetical protein